MLLLQVPIVRRTSTSARRIRVSTAPRASIASTDTAVPVVSASLVLNTPYFHTFTLINCIVHRPQLIDIGSEALYREKLCTFRSGTNCEINVDDCASSPCENDGVCTDGVDSFTCDCGEDTMGLRCQDDPCATTPCQHGGTCLVTRHAMPAWWPMCKPTSSNILRVAFSHFSRIR